MPGVVYNMQPQPPVEENTRWFEAGVVTIGVEYREVDPANLVETYKDSAEDMAELRERSPEGGFTDEGVSLHVRSTEDGHEFVRFDVFDGEPHYHYVRPTGDHNNVVSFDPVADGDYVVRQQTFRAKTIAGQDYCNVYCFVFRFGQDGKIAYLTEHWNTWHAYNVLFNNFDMEPAHPEG